MGSPVSFAVRDSEGPSGEDARDMNDGADTFYIRLCPSIELIPFGCSFNTLIKPVLFRDKKHVLFVHNPETAVRKQF